MCLLYLKTPSSVDESHKTTDDFDKQKSFPNALNAWETCPNSKTKEWWYLLLKLQTHSLSYFNGYSWN